MEPVFGEVDMLNDSSNFQFGERPGQKIDRDLEARLHLERGYGEMRATFRWFCWNRALIHVPAILFYILAGSFFLCIFEDLTWGSLNWLLLIPAGILFLALLGIYLVLATLINHARVEISSRTLKVKHGPLPYPGNCSIPCSEIKELCTFFSYDVDLRCHRS